MAKKPEYDLTPLEVVKVATEKLPSWALSVARMDLDQVMGKSFLEKKPLEYEKLQNLLANYLVAGKNDYLFQEAQKRVSQAIDKFTL